MFGSRGSSVRSQFVEYATFEHVADKPPSFLIHDFDAKRSRIMSADESVHGHLEDGQKVIVRVRIDELKRRVVVEAMGTDRLRCAHGTLDTVKVGYGFISDPSGSRDARVFFTLRNFVSAAGQRPNFGAELTTLLPKLNVSMRYQAIDLGPTASTRWQAVRAWVGGETSAASSPDGQPERRAVGADYGVVVVATADFRCVWARDLGRVFVPPQLSVDGGRFAVGQWFSFDSLPQTEVNRCRYRATNLQPARPALRCELVGGKLHVYGCAFVGAAFADRAFAFCPHLGRVRCHVNSTENWLRFKPLPLSYVSYIATPDPGGSFKDCAWLAVSLSPWQVDVAPPKMDDLIECEATFVPPRADAVNSGFFLLDNVRYGRIFCSYNDYYKHEACVQAAAAQYSRFRVVIVPAPRDEPFKWRAVYARPLTPESAPAPAPARARAPVAPWAPPAVAAVTPVDGELDEDALEAELAMLDIDDADETVCAAESAATTKDASSELDEEQSGGQQKLLAAVLADKQVFAAVKAHRAELVDRVFALLTGKANPVNVSTALCLFYPAHCPKFRSAATQTAPLPEARLLLSILQPLQVYDLMKEKHPLLVDPVVADLIKFTH